MRRGERAEQAGNDVDADDLTNERRQGERERSGARARVESALVSLRCDERTHLLSNRCDLLRSVLGDEALAVAPKRARTSSTFDSGIDHVLAGVGSGPLWIPHVSS